MSLFAQIALFHKLATHPSIRDLTWNAINGDEIANQVLNDHLIDIGAFKSTDLEKPRLRMMKLASWIKSALYSEFRRIPVKNIQKGDLYTDVYTSPSLVEGVHISDNGTVDLLLDRKQIPHTLKLTSLVSIAHPPSGWDRDWLTKFLHNASRGEG